MISIFFFKPIATTEIYTLSLHDALPISKTYGMSFFERAMQRYVMHFRPDADAVSAKAATDPDSAGRERSEEHTSELQSHSDLVCRLLLEKKKKYKYKKHIIIIIKHMNLT